MDFISAYPGQATLAIDNIQFQSCGRPIPTTNNCPLNQIKCKNNVCMNRFGLCDGLNDCGDNSDELLDKCASLQVNTCTFELTSSACISTQEIDPGSNAIWRTMSSMSANTNQNMLRMTGPTFDHTYRLADK